MASTASQPMSPPFLYKILSSPPPDPLGAVVSLPELDKSSGFVHLSSLSQVPNTAAGFFGDATKIWLLRLRTTALQEVGKVEWEEVSGVGSFPHLYPKAGQKLDELLRREAVDGVVVCERKGGEKWGEEMVKDEKRLLEGM